MTDIPNIVNIDMNTSARTDMFPVRLRSARELRRLSQADLAERAGLPATSISHFEAGSRKPSFDNLRKLADTLEVTADYLLGRADTPGGLAEDALHRHVEKLTAENRDLAEALILAERNLVEEFLKLLAERKRNLTSPASGWGEYC